MTTVAVIGLGYVGLPLVVEFAKQGRTIGFDIHEGKVAACRAGTDPSRELTDAQMAEAVHAEYTSNGALLGEADIIIVAVSPHGPYTLGYTRATMAVTVGSNRATGS